MSSVPPASPAMVRTTDRAVSRSRMTCRAGSTNASPAEVSMTPRPSRWKRGVQEKYRGRFDHGWDRQREVTLERQKELGVVPPETKLAPWAEDVPHWDELTGNQRRLSARFMETFAGFTEHADVQVGRFVDALEELGELDDTLFLYILGDNGASGEGGLEGTIVEHRLGHGVVDDPDEMIDHIDEIGGPLSYPIAPAGWALALNTPYQWTKQVASHFGGTRDGMILHWPRGVSERGGLRHQFSHVIDVLPTTSRSTARPTTRLW
ncbi:sulfatase-like hydrolase/transferase [Streptomyces coeruleorubidus]|uniref:sulfatase-like hydrolase/transferase n=1 Tax=Streptomyces coeruleorubidus TaxID=116188 RepID=UPI0033CA3563